MILFDKNSQLQTEKEQFLIDLRTSGIIIVGPKTKLKDGSFSPIYVNMRSKFWDEARLLKKIGELFFQHIKTIAPLPHSDRKVVCGIPEAANPLATATVLAAQDSRYPMSLIALRQKAKEHGLGGQSPVIGEYRIGDLVYLLDDVVTTSKSKREAIDSLIAGGFPPNAIHVVVAFDRQQGGLESLIRDGFQASSLFKILDVAQFFLDKELITLDELADIQSFIKEHQVQ
jgi:orotate phosphoribosyltransferase